MLSLYLIVLWKRFLFCNWKYRLAFSSSRRSSVFRESTSSMLPCISWIAGRSRTSERFCALYISRALEEYFLENKLGESLLHWTGRLFVVDSYLVWWFSDRSAGNQRVFSQPLHTGLKINQSARDTFAWPESRFAICLEGVWIAPKNDRFGSCCGYLSPEEIDSAL